MSDTNPRTTVYLTPELKESCEKAKDKGFKLSVFVRKQLEKYFAESPEFLKDQIESLDSDISKFTKYKESLKQKYKDAVELQNRRKEQLAAGQPELMDYRTATPKKKVDK